MLSARAVWVVSQRSRLGDSALGLWEFSLLFLQLFSQYSVISSLRVKEGERPGMGRSRGGKGAPEAGGAAGSPGWAASRQCCSTAAATTRGRTPPPFPSRRAAGSSLLKGWLLLPVSQVRFMLETLLALKNNDVRKIPGYDPEPVERLRKLQRGLVSPPPSSLGAPPPPWGPLLLPGEPAPPPCGPLLLRGEPTLLPGSPPSSLRSEPPLLPMGLLLLPGEHPLLPGEPSFQLLCSPAALSHETSPTNRGATGQVPVQSPGSPGQGESAGFCGETPPHLVSCGCPCAEPSATQRLTGVSSGRGPTQTSEVSLGVRARLLKFPGTSRRGPLWQLPQPQALVPSLHPTDHRPVGGVLTAGVGSPWTPVGPLSSHNTSGDGPRKLTLGGLL